MQVLKSAVATVLRPPSSLQITCIGVFDTVGSLGVPVGAFWRENRDLYEFHDVGLSPICEYSLHALAIDEHREPFEATLWRPARLGKGSARAQQVWFAGAHGDIGGGYIDEQQRALNKQAALDDITLDWMMRRVLRISKNSFPINIPDKPDDAVQQEARYLAPQHEPRRGIYRFMPTVWRSLLSTPVPIVRGLERNVCYDRHAEGIGEAIHISAIRRLGREVRVNSTRTIYSPRNLLSALEARRDIAVIDWNSKLLGTADANGVISDAVKRLTGAELPSETSQCAY
jgi:Uncharacterized alpha/beta hydrolase domain (DUF2235)